MLGKLLKYDFKAGKIVLPFYLLSAALSAILLGMIAFGVFPTKNYILSTVGGILAFFLVISFIALMVVSVVNVILHFGKQTIGAQGPIMFTLPVTGGKFLLSKLISGTVISLVAVGYGFFLLFMFALSTNGGKIYFGGELWMGIALLALVAVIMILSIIFSLLLVYLSIGLSGYISQNRVLGSIAAYLVLSFVLQILFLIAVVIISIILMAFGVNNAGVMFTTAGALALFPIIIISVSIGLFAILDIGMFFICRHLYTKKLNLP